MFQANLAQMILLIYLPCLLVLVTSVGTGNFNLFLNESETSRLLGKLHLQQTQTHYNVYPFSRVLVNVIFYFVVLY